MHLPSVPRPMLRWQQRTQAERVRIYTLSSIYCVFVGVVIMGALTAVGILQSTRLILTAVLVGLLLGVGGVLALYELLRTDRSTRLSTAAWTMVGLGSLGSAVIAVAKPTQGGFSMVLLTVFALSWVVGAMEDRRVWAVVIVAAGAFGYLGSREVVLAAYAVGAAMFLLFTMRSSLWLMRVVDELESGRDTAAALAVAEERLRFSRDVHDVMGRRLSEIAVQAELASALVARGDQRATTTLADVRSTAHSALREARELARGYRPIDLDQELEGARSLLRSAGIETRADLSGLPPEWAEPVARVIREGVTNVLRHSRATTVVITHHAGVVTIRNDGVINPPTASAAGLGSGLQGLGELVADLSARIETEVHGEDFVLRVVATEAA